jgi:hypothetical protein
MFERWASDILATYLGHFLDLQPEQLRISLFSGEPGCGRRLHRTLHQLHCIKQALCPR